MDNMYDSPTLHNCINIADLISRRNIRDGFAISYIFEFNRGKLTPIIEGATVGNSTRYINHAPQDASESALPLEYFDDDPERPILANCEGKGALKEFSFPLKAISDTRTRRNHCRRRSEDVDIRL